MRWPWKRKPKTGDGRCKNMSGWLTGYPCELPKGHDGKHEFVISTTTTNGLETSRHTASWF